MSGLTKAARLFDSKPYTVQLYVTDRCNLACDYCNEYTPDAPHPETADLKRRMAKARELGVLRINLLGGEPLMHPDIVELVRHAREIGFISVGMSTNGFLLTEELVHQLAAAGLTSCQVSVDRLTPGQGTQKSLKSVQHKLGWFKGSGISMTVTGVLCADTLDETRQLIDHCVERNVPVAARLVHDDMVNGRQLSRQAPTERLIELLEYQVQLKKQGKPIHCSFRLLDYQLAALRGEPVKWTCLAGYKFFCISGSGQFWPCSQLRTGINVMDLTPETLKGHDRKKDCQQGCGVYCIISTSFMFNHPLRGVLDELREARHKRRSSALTAKSAPSAPAP